MAKTVSLAGQLRVRRQKVLQIKKANRHGSQQDTKWVTRLDFAIDAFRAISQDITANQMLVFLQIGARPGITQKELSQAVRLPDGTISRICALMSERGHQGRQGLCIISIDPVPGDHRSRGQSLTAKGKSMFEKVQSAMVKK